MRKINHFSVELEADGGRHTWRPKPRKITLNKTRYIVSIHLPCKAICVALMQSKGAWEEGRHGRNERQRRSPPSDPSEKRGPPSGLLLKSFLITREKPFNDRSGR